MLLPPVNASDSNTPAIAAPALGTVRVGYFWGLDKLVHQLGGDAREILTYQGLDSRAFENPDNTIECLSAVNLLEYCSKELRDPLFGLHLAATQDPNVFGCVIALAQAAPTLRQALRCLVEFIPVSASPECELEIVTTKKDLVEIRWRTHIGFGNEAQTNFHGLMIILKTLHLLGRQHLRPAYATLCCDIDRSTGSKLRDSVGCRVYGKSVHNAIAFSVDALDAPQPTSNQLLFSILGQGLTQVREASTGSYIDKVRFCVRQALSAGDCHVDQCAARLNTSTRTLQKRLTRLGIKFSDIVRDERIKLAKHALQWSDYSLDEIAYQLGYSEQTSFGRAFKLATGYTPKAFRSEKQVQSH